MKKKIEAAISGPMFDLIGEVRRQGIPDVRIQKLIESGLFARLLKANVGGVDKVGFDRLLGLQGPPSPMHISKGLFRGFDEVRAEFANLGLHIGEWASRMLNQINAEAYLPGIHKGVTIAIISSAKLGFSGEFSYREIFEAAAKKGWGKCTVEDAIMIRRSYWLQPYGEYIRIAMDPIPDGKENPSIFYLGNTDENGLLIEGVCGDLDRRWSHHSMYWAFRSES